MVKFGAGFGFNLPFANDSSDDGDIWRSRGMRVSPEAQISLTKPDEYVVDGAGSGDFLTISGALAKLGNSAGTIRVLAGNYTITAPIVLQKNQTIMGSGYGTNITTTKNITMVNLSGARSAIFHCRIDGNNTGYSQRGVVVEGTEGTIRNCWIGQMGDIGVQVNASKCIIEGCRIEDCSDRCIDATEDFMVINDCYIDNSSQDGIQMVSADHCVIVGNQIINHGEHGIDMTSSSYATIVGNYIYSNGDNNNNGDGIEIDAGNENCIVGNICKGNDGVGIDINSGNYNLIVGNICRDNEDGAIADGGTSSLSGMNIIA